MKPAKMQIPPCRPYEINAAQTWLSDMSAVGLHPEHDFIFAGLAFFERGACRRYRYRFDTAKRPTMFDDGGVDAEQQMLCADAGWELCGIWGDFAVYRSPQDEAEQTPELHTDPALHAAAYKKVRRRALDDLLWIVLMAIIWLRMMFGGTALLDAVLGIGLVSRLLSAMIILWGLYLGVEHWFSMYTYCRRLQRRARRQVPSVSEHEDIREECSWQRRAWHRRISFVCSILLICAWLCSGFVSFVRAADDRYTLPLAGNEDTLPFALMQDLYEGSTFAYSAMDWSNEIRQHDDLFIPVHLQVLQNGTITHPDGTVASGGLTVRYIETVSEKFTALLGRQFRTSDERDKHFGGYRDLSPAVLDCISALGDDMEVYAYSARFPTVLMCRGNVLIYITYYGDAYSSPDAVICAMAESIAASAAGNAGN